ncbi:T9SS type A sorting domain-containing protein [Terrimonas pollutisoli]|uniref:T9SS type A sorting domain-containing protein n=1 Tax=Terrimonas pollutisoli TaxID=3034147 RepID=UPI0023EC49CE|nr:T9SS type A sorting domain-containing protein [Terrimonas sp. H1YJ31]
MKTFLHVILLVLISWTSGSAQITWPATKARFGVDGDLRANYTNGAVASGNDDWFNNGTAGTGEFVIDTTGAAAMIATYLADASPWKKRMSSFYRTMSKPSFSVVQNRLWLDAIFVRDYHATDTTVYVSGSDKNGMSPAMWTGGVQGVPDKNDILDMMVHVRRAGPNTTDSLWMFGGISLDNTTGNRYFDFEMYQTDIYYDRVSQKFYGYGADAGHTAWLFDAAGNITRPGDIIFSGEFQSGTLTNIEARIWVKKTDWQAIVPSSFNWGGLFDGDGSGATYGYASIAPNSTGSFYTGLGSSNSTWSGPFGLVLQDNSLAYTNPGPASTLNGKYIANQFIEFSVNLTKLGLDPVTLLGGDICSSPFNRIVVKTRASASFTAELKDFVAPTDLFLAPRAVALTETPMICDDGSGVAEIYVTNPLATSTYQWTTTDGSIISSPTGPSIYVDHAGTYIVTQYLQAGCSVYATDTVQVLPFNTCTTLSSNLFDFRGVLSDNISKLSWKLLSDGQVKYFEVERSFDGINFTTIDRVETHLYSAGSKPYYYEDMLDKVNSPNVYYRIKLVNVSGANKYSSIINIPVKIAGQGIVNIFPNPVKDIVQIQVDAKTSSKIRVEIFELSGKLIHVTNTTVQRGYNVITIDQLKEQPRGVYLAQVHVGDDTFHEKILLTR